MSLKESSDSRHKDNADLSHVDAGDFPGKEVTVTGKLQVDATGEPEKSPQDTVKTPQQVGKMTKYDNITPYIAALIIQRAWRRHIVSLCQGLCNSIQD